MTQQLTTMTALNIWYSVSTKAMAELDFDLTPRQISLLLRVYLEEGPHTVKNLSEHMSISKAAVCRALDKLSIAKLLKRKKDEDDRRNIFIQRTMHGSVFLSDFADFIVQAVETSQTTDNASESITKATTATAA